MHIQKEMIDMNIRSKVCVLLVSIACIGFRQSVVAQDSTINLERQSTVHGLIGISLPELIHVGARYQIDNLQFGINVGSFPAGSEGVFTYSADCIVYALGSHNSLNNKRWYGKLGITSMRDETEFKIDKYVYSHIRIGHEFALSNSVALQLEGGVMMELSHSEIQKKPSNSWFNFDFDFHVLPSVGLTTVFTL